MSKKMTRLCAALLALALVLTGFPAARESAFAAGSPAFSKSYSWLTENASNKGIYSYKVVNLKKGYIVRWSLAGAGKAYAKLKSTRQVATGTSVTNKITISTGGAAAAKNAKVRVTAKIYDASKKLVTTLSSTPKIRIFAKSAAIKAASSATNLNKLITGVSYGLNLNLTPTNATDTVTWKVTDELNDNCTSYISGSSFTPQYPGTYTISATAKTGKVNLVSTNVTVKVYNDLKSVTQKSLNKFEMVFSADVSKRITASNITIKGDNGSSMSAIGLTCDTAGTTVTVTTKTNFTDGVKYTVTYAKESKDFTASAGEPANVNILTTQVEVDRTVKLQYALLDKNGIDVSSLYTGTVSYSHDIKHCTINKAAGTITMDEVGVSGKLTAEVTYAVSGGTKTVSGSGTILCIAMKAADTTSFTLTSSAAAPDFAASDYTAKTVTYIGDTTYAHFEALDSTGEEIVYDTVKFSSSDVDGLIIDSTSGAITPIKTGTYKITVSAVKGSSEFSYSFNVTVTQKPYLKTVVIEEPSIEVSNYYDYNYVNYLNLAGFDQNSDDISLTGETWNFTKLSGASGTLTLGYIQAENRISVKAQGVTAGTYNYRITLTMGSYSASADFVVVVKSVPATGTVTYRAVAEKASVDLTLKSDTTVKDVTNQIRLARYTDGVFSGYLAFSVSGIVNAGGANFGTSLQNGTMSSAYTCSGVSVLTLTLASMTPVDSSSYTYKTAAAGTYIVKLGFTDYSNGSTTGTTTVSFIVTGNSKNVTASVTSTSAGKTCATALDLAKACIAVSEGAITECTVTGSSTAGSAYKIESGKMYNISTVTVKTTTALADGKSVVYTPTIAIGKTLTNK